jgi:hypothetical protein
MPLLAAAYSIQAATDDPSDVTIAQETSDNLLHGMVGMTWHSFLRQLYLFRGIYGHAIFEKCWTVDQGASVRLRKLAPRLAKTLWRWYPNDDDELDRIEQRVWVTDKDGISGQYEYPILPAQKLLRSTRQQIGNNWLGTSLYRACYKHWYYKDQLYAIDGVAAAKNAMGVPLIAETQPNPDIVRQMSDRLLATQSLGAYQANERSYFYMPYGYTFDLKAVTGAVRDILPSIQHHDLLIARSFLAQFINMDSGGDLIAARDASSFFLEALTAEAVEAADDINPLLREMEQYNYTGRARFSTLQMAGLEQRRIEEYLRGVAALITAGGLTVNAETENAFRDKLDLPQLPIAATPAGGDAYSVDHQVQGQEAAGAEEQQAKVDAIVRNPGAPPPSPEPPELARLLRSFRAQDAARSVRAAALVRHAGVGLGAVQGPQGIRPEGTVTVPRADGTTRTLSKAGGRWETYSRSPSLWSGWGGPQLRLSRETGAPYLLREADGADWVCLERAPASGHRVPNPNQPGLDNFDDEDAQLRGYEYVRWRLGDGGVSGTHCPQCVKMAQRGLMKLSELHIEPGSGDTYCTDNCTCSLQYLRPARVNVGRT